MTWPLWLGLLLALATAGVFAYGSKRWTDATRVLQHSLEAARTDGKAPSASPARFDSHELENLPAPVQRYFRAVLKEGQPIISALTIEMVGTFNMSAAAERWKAFTSRQRVATHRPGFLWDAQVSIVPGLLVRVVDSYIAGSGLLHAAILGVFSVAKVSGGAEVARGEFMRYFAEAAWYPTALLPSQGVRWEEVDDRSANATIVDGPLTLTLLFRFNHAGLIDSVRAGARGAMVGNKLVMLPWECSLSNYEVRDGMTVPITGEASWVRPEGRKPYFRGTITSLTYEFAPSQAADAHRLRAPVSAMGRAYDDEVDRIGLPILGCDSRGARPSGQGRTGHPTTAAGSRQPGRACSSQCDAQQHTAGIRPRRGLARRHRGGQASRPGTAGNDPRTDADHQCS